MMTSDDKVGGWVKKGQNHDDVILECPPSQSPRGTVINLVISCLRSLNLYF